MPDVPAALDSAHRRHRLVYDLQQRGYALDPLVADAMKSVPRESFLPPDKVPRAYEDIPLSIGWGQTISAPHMVAFMCDQLRLTPGLHVLEVGSGCGYHAAVVAHCLRPDGFVTSLEYEPGLAEFARDNLARAGVANVEVRQSDGGRGLPLDAPFDRIYLTCAARKVPAPLLEQVAPDGILLAPIGANPARLLRMERENGEWQETDLGACAFVPLRGEWGR